MHGFLDGFCAIRSKWIELPNKSLQPTCYPSGEKGVSEKGSELFVRRKTVLPPFSMKLSAMNQGIEFERSCVNQV